MNGARHADDAQNLEQNVHIVSLKIAAAMRSVSAKNLSAPIIVSALARP